LARSVASLQAWSLPHQGRLWMQGALAPALFLPRRMGYRTNGRRVRYGRGRGVRKLGREAAAPDDRERSGERVWAWRQLRFHRCALLFIPHYKKLCGWDCEISRSNGSHL
jgi:hypothetical protein